MAITDAPYTNNILLQGYDRLGIRSVADLIRHYPARYEIRPDHTPIASLTHNANGSTSGTLTSSRWVAGWGRAKGRFEAVLQDDSESLRLVWFNSPFLRDKLHPGITIAVTGKVKRSNGFLEMVNPRWSELAGDQTDPDEASPPIRPVYPTTEGLTSDRIAGHIKRTLDWALPHVQDPIPESLRSKQNLLPLDRTFDLIHRPQSEDDYKAARRRLAYNELILLQLGIQLKRAHTHHRYASPAIESSERVDQRIRDRLPFTLTPAQDHAVRQIAQDLATPVPMNRLLQGDVGAGKTLVAVYAMLLAASQGWSSALMAPTEVLAVQHYQRLAELLRDAELPVDLVTAGIDTPTLTPDNPRLLVGTQALLNREGITDRIALVIIDEQHRFGVRQRGHLRQTTQTSATGVLQKIHRPHQLVMTATPIPRTLALSLFGDLDVSTISQPPSGRRPIRTVVSPPQQIDIVHADILKRVAAGEPGFIVLPTIDDQGDDDQTAKGVEARARQLMNSPLGEYGIEIAHGRMTPAQRAAAMKAFSNGRSRVLVATTVIEVGVDVPDAGWMVIEQADRFGLAQLHQLRGRIGRTTGDKPCICHLIAQPTTDQGQQRMAAITQSTDGFKIAELDLQIRGMGEFYGTRQAGASPLRMATLPDDEALLKLAGRDANDIIKSDPSLSNPEHKLLRKVLERQLGENIDLIDIA
ncbi:ATP-dependent DNA helicase RecG [Mucisphaera calidilacus]|uniref:Probable DNA 3'-5' helicase RecG n=2 Tax=Mucisphaera calidilacus TaxID=2527982 RepID=A0A518BXJ6_9BACT|nr:ATP-dependent DNA helicase RecG [Mucisphaera calidilacus]